MSNPKISNGFPFVLAPDEMDQWPSPKAAKQAFDNISQIIGLGFAGVKSDISNLNDGRELINLSVDLASPEGRVAKKLIQLAKEGESTTSEEVIKALERIYREENISLPYAMEVVK